jgi:hypothetical protein
MVNAAFLRLLYTLDDLIDAEVHRGAHGCAGAVERPCRKDPGVSGEVLNSSIFQLFINKEK